MNQVVLFILCAIFFSVVITAERENTESDKKFLCAIKCWKQSKTKNALTESLKDCLKKCKKPEAATEAEADSICATSRGSHTCQFSEETESDTAIPVNQEYLWEQYRTVLTNAITRGQDRPLLQILTQPIDALWDSEDPEQLKRICNNVPYWGPYYSASPYKIDEQYKQFINNIRTDANAIKSVEDKAEADKYNEDIKRLGEQLTTERSKCIRKFTTTTPKPEFAGFMNTCLAGLNAQVEDAKLLYQFFMARAYTDSYVDLMESRTDVELGTEWFEVQNSLKRMNDNAKSGQLTKLTVNVDRFTSVNIPKSWNEIAKGLTRPSSLTGSFFNVAVSGSSGIQTSTEKFTMSIEFEGYGVIRVAPGKWFRHNVLNNFRNGPFIHSQANLFGANGTMRLKPTTFYIAYKPKMTLTVDRKDTAIFHGQAGKSSSGFFSSKSESATVTTENVNADTVRVVIQSNSYVPKIIAIDNEALPDY